MRSLNAGKLTSLLAVLVLALVLNAAPLALHAATPVRATELIGTPVRNAQGESLGEIARIVLDLENDRVEYVLLEYEKPFRLGRKLFVFRLREFSRLEGSEGLVLQASPERLEDSLGFYDRRWPHWNEPPWHQDDDTPRTPARERVDQLIGETVYTPRGEAIGKLQDFVIDFDSGRVQSAVVDVEDRGNVAYALDALAVRRIGGEVRVEAATAGSTRAPGRSATGSSMKESMEGTR